MPETFAAHLTINGQPIGWVDVDVGTCACCGGLAYRPRLRGVEQALRYDLAHRVAWGDAPIDWDRIAPPPACCGCAGDVTMYLID